MDRLTKLYGRACDLSSSYHLKAMGEIFDAIIDLARWPDEEKRILNNCEEFISYWEKRAKEES